MSARLGKDFLGVIGLAVLAIMCGLAVNRFGSHPLSLVYVSPEQKLQDELNHLVNGPPLDSFPVDTISLDQFRADVDDKTVTILDARASTYFDQGHVPRAINLSRQDFGSDYVRLQPILDPLKDKPIVVYCAGGACHDSKMVAQALTALGFSQVQIYSGGWDGWTAAGLPVVHS
ncbi:MAG TPA: rhodanese-like domain-containing protein [Candidatus Binataceae bacterium]|nr:rhodanese-like domain-containing protein [Candidatus Binataceae bacterium]